MRRSHRLTTVVAAALAVATSSAWVGAAPVGAQTVHTPGITTDESDGNHSAGDLSLREAFLLAELDGDDSVVVLAPEAHYTLTCGAFAGPVAYNPSSPSSLEVVGNGATIEQTCADHRVMTVDATTLSIEDLTITGGDATANGGGLFAVATTTISDSVIIDNVDQHTVDNGGGGVLNQGDLTILRSVLAHNRAASGAAATTTAGGDITLQDSTVVANTGTSTTSGVDASGDLTLVNTTVTDNTGPIGPVVSSGDTHLRHATVVGNTATVLGFSGVAAYVLGDLYSFASVVAGNTVDQSNCQIYGATTSSYSVEGDDGCGFTGTGDQQDVTDLDLGPARDNGGGRPTRFPLWDSILLDAVPAGDCDPTLPTDGRGVVRPFPAGGGCDIGAVEQIFPPSSLTDVPGWVTDAVAWITSDVHSPPIMEGYPDQTFRPNAQITRAQVVRLLYREAGSPAVGALPAHGFTDVPAWVESAVRWAKANDIMTGITATTFVPNDPITRAQVVRATYRLAGEPPVDPLAAHGFTDVPAWVESPVRWAKGHDLMTGITPTTFVANNPITRAQVARLAYRLAINPERGWTRRRRRRPCRSWPWRSESGGPSRRAWPGASSRVTALTPAGPVR